MVCMNNTTTMSLKVDKTLKARAQQTAKSIGIPLSTLINAYLNEMVTTGRVEFTASERMTPQMERVIAEAEAEIARGETIGPFKTPEEMFAALDAADDSSKS
jgi:addiction module RelB/DinJ family antitoxin